MFKKQPKKPSTVNTEKKEWSIEDIKKQINHCITNPQDSEIQEILTALDTSTLSIDEKIDCLKIQVKDKLNNTLGMTIIYHCDIKIISGYLDVLENLKNLGATTKQFHSLNKLQNNNGVTFWIWILEEQSNHQKERADQYQYRAFRFLLDLIDKDNIDIICDEFELCDCKNNTILHLIASNSFFLYEPVLSGVPLLIKLFACNAPADRIFNLLNFRNTSGQVFQYYLWQKGLIEYLRFRLDLLKKIDYKKFYYFSAQYDKHLYINNNDAFHQYLLYMLELTKKIYPTNKINELIHLDPGKAANFTLDKVSKYASNLNDIDLIYKIMSQGLCVFYYENSTTICDTYSNFQDKLDLITQHILTLSDEEKKSTLEKIKNPNHPMGKFFNTYVLEETYKNIQNKISASITKNNEENNRFVLVIDPTTKEQWRIPRCDVEKLLIPEAKMNTDENNLPTDKAITKPDLYPLLNNQDTSTGQHLLDSADANISDPPLQPVNVFQKDLIDLRSYRHSILFIDDNQFQLECDIDNTQKRTLTKSQS